MLCKHPKNVKYKQDQERKKKQLPTSKWSVWRNHDHNIDDHSSGPSFCSSYETSNTELETLTFCVYVLLNKRWIVILFRIVPAVFMCTLKEKDHQPKTFSFEIRPVRSTAMKNESWRKTWHLSVSSNVHLLSCLHLIYLKFSPNLSVIESNIVNFNWKMQPSFNYLPQLSIQQCPSFGMTYLNDIISSLFNVPSNNYLMITAK